MQAEPGRLDPALFMLPSFREARLSETELPRITAVGNPGRDDGRRRLLPGAERPRGHKEGLRNSYGEEGRLIPSLRVPP